MHGFSIDFYVYFFRGENSQVKETTCDGVLRHRVDSGLTQSLIESLFPRGLVWISRLSTCTRLVRQGAPSQLFNERDTTTESPVAVPHNVQHSTGTRYGHVEKVGILP